jgi:aspartyl-tRNA(Asn)/glutamyl-tRNA(Gln) amidotransferase subunit B
MQSGVEAAEYARMVHRIVKQLKISDGNLEEGSFRCDCNVSVRKKGSSELGTRVEIKNLNSFRFVEKAIESEVNRQISLLEQGSRVSQETRLYDSTKNLTQPMRKKEEAKDYRYFPDPDLPLMVISESDKSEWAAGLGKGPFEEMRELVSDWRVGLDEASVLVDDPEELAYLRAIARLTGDPKQVANWYLSEARSLLGSGEPGAASSEKVSHYVSESQFVELLQLIAKGEISGKAAKEVLRFMWGTKKSPGEIVSEKGLGQVSDAQAIRDIVRDVLAHNAEQVKELVSGKEKVRGFLVGQIMKLSKGKANPELANKVLREEIDRLKAKD